MYPTLARVHALAIAIMVDLACRSGAGPVPSEDLRRRVRLSISYFERIAADLRRHRLMQSTRNRGRGNELGRAASLISMRDIVEAMHAPLAGAAHPHRRRDADVRAALPMSLELWDAVERRQLEWLGSVTLDDMVQDCLRRERSAGAVPAPRLGAAIALATTESNAQSGSARKPQCPRFE
jgi:Rrf2 family iron-sulfur cluster assembly transcriptional regulator